MRRKFTASVFTFLATAFSLLIFLYPIWKVTIGGHIDLERIGFDPIWRADRTYTIGWMIGVELGFAVLVALLIFACYEPRNPREI